MYLRVPHYVLTTCRRLTLTSITADSPSGNALTTPVRRRTASTISSTGLCVLSFIGWSWVSSICQRLIKLQSCKFSCFVQTHAPWFVDDLTNFLLSSLATFLRADGFDPGRHDAGLVARNVAEHVVVEMKRAALPVANLI